ncbi:MAG: TrkA family potassium uptake protein [Eubacteriaceae bacterium]|nr:TrkA family potassium uptake protein [Eubacteriaceae bacterium]
MKQFAVIGIGRFGFSLATKLYELGYDVLAIDRDEERIKAIADKVTYAVQADSTDINTLKAIGLRNIDVVVVSIASDINASLMSTLNVQELGIKEIYAKAQSEQHAKVLRKVGIERVFLPEHDMGKRVAHHIVSNNILDLIELDPDHSIIEVNALISWENKSLEELNLRARYGITVIALKRGMQLNISPKALDKIQKKDILVVIGDNDSLSAIQSGENETA